MTLTLKINITHQGGKLHLWWGTIKPYLNPSKTILVLKTFILVLNIIVPTSQWKRSNNFSILLVLKSFHSTKYPEEPWQILLKKRKSTWLLSWSIRYSQSILNLLGTLRNSLLKSKDNNWRVNPWSGKVSHRILNHPKFIYNGKKELPVYQLTFMKMMTDFGTR